MLLATFVPAPVSAGGIASARFGGEHGNPTEPNPTALYFNPAGIGLSDGTHLMLDVGFLFRNLTYTRSARAIDASTFRFGRAAGSSRRRILEANAGAQGLDNILFSPMAGASTDFGFEELPVRVGLAYFVPFSGVSVWDRAAPVEGIPGAVDGTARWHGIEGGLRTDAFALGVAYRARLGEHRLAFGVTGNLYRTRVETIVARNPDGTDQVQEEGRSLLDVSSTDMGLGLGVLWEPLRDALWLGASYQSRPNLDGGMGLDGTLVNDFDARREPTEQPVVLTHRLPDIIRLGARWRPIPIVELRLHGNLTRWSALRQQCLVRASVDDMGRACETRDDGGLAREASSGEVEQIFQRRWKDTFGVAVGGSYWALAWLELLGGVGYDGNAVPARTLEPGYPDAVELRFSLGARVRVHRRLRLMLTATELLYVDRDTRAARSHDSFAQPSRQPGAQGLYEQNVFLVQANAEVTF